jgi:hypothetical protein
MRKKTASRTRKHPEVTGNQTSGLIAKGKEPRQSVGEKSVLDNRSHRTPGYPLGPSALAFALNSRGSILNTTGPGPAGPRRLHGFWVRPVIEGARLRPGTEWFVTCHLPMQRTTSVILTQERHSFSLGFEIEGSQ